MTGTDRGARDWLARRGIRRAVIGLAMAGLVSIGFTGGLAVAGVDPFSDTPPWIRDHAVWLHDFDIANGYPDGTFRPNQNITRGQAAFWLGNYNDQLRLVTSRKSFTASGVTHDVSCGQGRAVAGGGTISVPGAWMLESRPNSSRWQVTWEMENSDVRTGFVDVWAFCIPQPVN